MGVIVECLCGGGVRMCGNVGVGAGGGGRRECASMCVWVCMYVRVACSVWGCGTGWWVGKGSGVRCVCMRVCGWRGLEHSHPSWLNFAGGRRSASYRRIFRFPSLGVSRSCHASIARTSSAGVPYEVSFFFSFKSFLAAFGSPARSCPSRFYEPPLRRGQVKATTQARAFLLESNSLPRSTGVARKRRHRRIARLLICHRHFGSWHHPTPPHLCHPCLVSANPPPVPCGCCSEPPG